jgi:phosphatidylinositol alpha 1,6-mannosyltransferase
MAYESVLERAAPSRTHKGGRALRVAIFSGNYNYIRDGASLTLNRLVEYLERQGVVVRVFAPTSKTPAFPPTGELVSVPSFPFPGRKEYRVAIGYPIFFQRSLEEFAPDIIHLSAPDWLGAGALKYALKQRLRVVASLHTRFDAYWKYYGLHFLGPMSTHYLKYFYGSCAQVYVPSESMAQSLRADGIECNMRVWARGVDHLQFSPTKRSQELRASWAVDDHRPAVTYVGRLVTEKGLDTVVDAFARLRKSGVAHRPIIVGDGPEREWLEQRIPNAVFTGFLTGENLMQAYASSDVFFFPSATETFGNVTLEAMAAGLPAVCADATGSASLVQHGQTGFLCPVRDGERFAEAIAQLVGDPALRGRMASAARAAALEYSWDAQLSGVLAGYYELVPGDS